jgi:hypothetical protein
MLILCTVEAFPNSEQAPEACAPRRYPRAILHEDWLSWEDCRKFIDDVQKGQVTSEPIGVDGWRERGGAEPDWTAAGVVGGRHRT